YQIDTLNHSIDIHQHHLQIIQAPLNEAQSHDNLSFKYIHRILLNCKNKDVNTLQQSKNLTQHYPHPQITHKLKKIAKFHCLDPES
ncbi:DnaD domain protein, partial [Staphylococcus pettenkoferi]|uniref:DnaD domain protein n=1 Tax=Staphylococcus pettenkoferi TaxID=170573 RepID=UPI0011A52F61